MSSIAKAIGPLVNIALLLLFAIIIFAIVGLEFYSGALNKTCYDIRDPRRNPVYVSNNDWVLSDKIMTEEDDGVPCAIGTEDSLPVGSFVCTLVLKSICWPTYSTLLHINCSLVLHQNNSVDTNICSLKGTLIKYSFRFNESICLEKWEGPNKGAVESFTAGKLKINISIPRNYFLRQHRPGHADNLSMCHHGGLDSHHVLGGLIQQDMPPPLPLYFFRLMTLSVVPSTGERDIIKQSNIFLHLYFRVFFIPLIVIGSFFMLNLVLGVLSGWVGQTVTDTDHWTKPSPSPLSCGQ